MSQDLNTAQVDVLAAALAQVMLNPAAYGADQSYPLFAGQKTVTGTPDAKYVHGPGGMFSSAGIDNVIVNAHMTPRDLDALLPVFPTVYTNPLYPSLTGFSEDTGDEPDGVCDDCLGGTMQGCNLTAAFGRICRESDEIEINRVMQMINRGETVPLTVLGDVLGPGNMTKMPNTPKQWLNVITKAEMVKVAILHQRKLVKMTWNGNPANNTANGGYKEFPGLEMLVGTGKVDAETGVACASLDSLVFDFAYNDIAAAIAGNDIVVYISMMVYYEDHIASRTGMDPVKRILAMRPQLFYELTAIWPCRYHTDRCSDVNGAQVVVMNDDTNTNMRDAMRNGKFLTVNGRRIPVVLCDGMTEEHGDPGLPNFNAALANGEYASSIFYLPMTVRGGMKVLYWEHMDYTKAAQDIALSKSGNDFWTDGGRWFWTAERKRWCYKMAAKIEPRIILRTPQLAARLDAIKYTPLRHLRDFDPASPYFEKGGVSERDTPGTLYSEWNLPQI